jgi:pantetheine-phosphate adenylyltransferase
MARMNATLYTGLETVYLSASPQWAHVSSSLVRQIHTLGGSIDAFVPPVVVARLTRRGGLDKESRD